MLDYFDGKKLCPKHPGDSKKSTKSEKISKFQSPEKKNVSKSVQTCFEVIFSEKKCSVHPGRSKLGKISKKMEKLSFFSKCPKTFSKRFKHVLNMLRGNLSVKNFCAVHPGGSILGKTSEELEELSIFQNAQKSFPKAIKHVLNMFRGHFSGKNFAQCTLGGQEKKRWEKMENFNNSKMSKTVPNSVQACSEHVLR